MQMLHDIVWIQNKAEAEYPLTYLPLCGSWSHVGFFFFFFFLIKKNTPVILTTQEAEIRRIAVRSQLG
jgi:hypothetical protein